jgi:broad specificity phosphatase PhoE
MNSLPPPEICLARHGETEWTITGQHTGRSDIPLTERGERNARSLGERLKQKGTTFTQVLTSPLIRARRTCELAGFGASAVVDPDLMEWDYGDYDGKTSAQIRHERPDWNLFIDGCPGGETAEQVGRRADGVIARIRAQGGSVLVFSHSHFLRILASRWIGLGASDARLVVLSTASLSVLGYEHSLAEPAIRLWNDDRHVEC